MPVIGAAVAIFARGAAEFRHRDENYVIGSVAEVAIKNRQTVGQFFEAIGHLPLGAALIDVSIPPLDFRESDFQSKVGFYEASDLGEAGAEASVRIALRRCGNSGLYLSQFGHGGEEILAAETKQRVRSGGVESL